MNKKRKRRHHTVPRFHLRGFATGADVLIQLDTMTGRKREISVGDAAVIRDFYTVLLPDGSRSDAWEDWLSEVENDIAPALVRAATMPMFRLSDDDRRRLSLWIALQYLRGPDNRRGMTDIAAMTASAQVGMGGLGYLHHAMSAGLGRNVSMEEAEIAWDDITGPAGPVIEVSGDEHLAILNQTFTKAAELIYARSWGRVRFAHRRLALADAPVYLVRVDTPDYMGLGLASAPAVAIPLDRRTLLWLSLATDGQPLDDKELEPTAALARAANTAAVSGAVRFVYFHPDDECIPHDVDLPRARPPRIEVVGSVDFANRDRPLAEVLQQIAEAGSPDPDRLIADYTWPIAGYRPRVRKGPR